MLRIAIVVHRYGEEVAGGAEGQARGFAEEAARRGWAVEVWTTCVRDHYTWQNEYPPGSERHGGVLVRRFPVIQWEKDAHGELELALEWRGSLPAPDQFEWLDTGVHSPALYEHVARHASDYDVLVALPYSQGLVHYAAWIAPRRVVLWPCLHNEAYACLQPVHLLLETVWGVMFNSPEEGDLATRQLGIRPQRAAILGEGVTLNLLAAAPSGDRRGDLLFVGRLEDGKSLALL
ncbi:MAG TPA: hypothetical protein VER55_06345, partial [Ardenticatenaceae bacterium]|nr:hypothetical protein [Ardenticatenaceae bacterium]